MATKHLSNKQTAISVSEWKTLDTFCTIKPKVWEFEQPMFNAAFRLRARSDRSDTMATIATRAQCECRLSRCTLE